MIKDDYGYFSPFLTNSLGPRLMIHPQHPSMICRILTPGGPKNHRTGEFFPCTQKKDLPSRTGLLLSNGDPPGTRTRDTLIKSQVLYQLS